MNERVMQVEEIIAEEFSVELNFKHNKSRTNKIIFPKKLLCSILYHKEGMNLEAVGSYMGFKDHSNVIHHLRTGEGLYACDEAYRYKADKVYNKVSNIYTIKTNINE
jgi:chromosomal replication initiation ATPase DnaA